MAIASLIPSLPQFSQPIPRSLLVLETGEGADRLVECVLRSGERFGSVVRSALDRGAAFDSGDELLDCLDHGLLGKLGADRDSARTVADRRAAVERPAALARADDQARAAGAAAQDAEPGEQALRLRTPATRHEGPLE